MKKLLNGQLEYARKLDHIVRVTVSLNDFSEDYICTSCRIGSKARSQTTVTIRDEKSQSTRELYCRSIALTSEEKESLHGGKRIISWSIEQVKAVSLASDPVDLTVEVLDGGRVILVKLVVQKPVDNGSFAHL